MRYFDKEIDQNSDNEMTSDDENSDNERMTIEPSICWKVTSKTGKISYLFGTMHAQFQIPPELQVLLKDVKRVAIEIEPEKIKNNIFEFFSKKEFFLDQFIIKYAREHGKELVSLDTEESALSLRGFRCSTSLMLPLVFKPHELHATLKKVSELDKKDALSKQESLYKNKDLYALQCIFEHLVSYSSDYYSFLYSRNKQWLKLIVPLLEEGQSCICVGIAHNIASNGLADNLLQKGYLLEPINMTIKHQKIQPNFFSADFIYKESLEMLKKLKLNEYVQAYRRGSITPKEKRILHEALRYSYSMINMDYPWYRGAMEVISKSHLSILASYKQLQQPPHMKSKHELEKHIIELFDSTKHHLYADLTSVAIQHTYALWTCCFFPSVAANLVKKFFNNDELQAAELFLMCGAYIDKQSLQSKSHQIIAEKYAYKEKISSNSTSVDTSNEILSTFQEDETWRLKDEGKISDKKLIDKYEKKTELRQSQLRNTFKKDIDAEVVEILGADKGELSTRDEAMLKLLSFVYKTDYYFLDDLDQVCLAFYFMPATSLGAVLKLKARCARLLTLLDQEPNLFFTGSSEKDFESYTRKEKLIWQTKIVLKKLLLIFLYNPHSQSFNKETLIETLDAFLFQSANQAKLWQTHINTLAEDTSLCPSRTQEETLQELRALYGITYKKEELSKKDKLLFWKNKTDICQSSEAPKSNQQIKSKCIVL